MPFSIDVDFNDPMYRLKLRLEPEKPEKTIRTYIDAYQALIRGYVVHLELIPDGGSSQCLDLHPWQYGRRDYLSQVRNAIDNFRDIHRPYSDVNWSVKRIQSKSQLQLQFKLGDLPVGATAVLTNHPGSFAGFDPDLHVQLDFHGNRHVKMEWVDLWPDWCLVDVSKRESCLATADFGQMLEVLKRAKDGDMIAASAWDWVSFHQMSRPWWKADVNDLINSEGYKSWERKLFEDKLREIF